MNFPGFVGGSYSDYSPNSALDETINLIPQKVETPQAKNGMELVGTPGLAAFGELPFYPIRGVWGGDGRMFAVAVDPGDDTKCALFEVLKDGTYINRCTGGAFTGTGTSSSYYVAGVNGASGTGPAGGPMDSDDKPVTFATNGNQLLVVSGGKVYCDSGNGPVAQNFLDPDTGDPTGDAVSASHCVFLDGFFIISGKAVTGSQTYGPKQINISHLYDGTKWDVLDFAVKEAYPDNIATIAVDHEDLWIFGDSNSSEVWQNTGAADFPFQRNPGAIIHQAAVPNSPVSASIANGVAWLGGDTRGWPVAWMARGYQPTRISNHSIERIWGGYSKFDDAVAYSYELEGHQCLVITFPTGNATWVWDATTGLWHRWAYGASFDRHKVMYHTFEWGMHLGADHTSGAIYKIDHSTYTDNGDPIVFRRTFPHVCDEQQRIPHHALRLDHESSANVTMTLAWSDDSGGHWSSEHAPDGKRVANGEAARIIASEWRRMGTARDRVYRLTGSGDGKRALINAYLNPKD